MNIDKSKFITHPLPQFFVVNNAEKTFGNLPSHKLTIELGERGLKNTTGFNMEFIKRGMGILYIIIKGKKIVSTNYVQDSPLDFIIRILTEKVEALIYYPLHGDLHCSVRM
jgi:hypothetical protein